MRSSPGRREQGEKPERITNCITVGFALVAAEDSQYCSGGCSGAVSSCRRAQAMCCAPGSADGYRAARASNTCKNRTSLWAPQRPWPRSGQWPTPGRGRGTRPTVWRGWKGLGATPQLFMSQHALWSRCSEHALPATAITYRAHFCSLFCRLGSTWTQL